MATESFGEFAHRLRVKKALGLRQAARKMGVSPAYLSQVERNKDYPSRRLLASMSQVYERPEAELQRAAERAGVQHREHGPRTRIEDLRALYRLGAMFTTEEVEGMVRHMLKQQGMADEEIEQQLSRFRADLPRIRKAGGDGLFAADIKPRFLSKHGVAQIAYRILASSGLDRSRYKPPTPIEILVESEEGISYIIDDLPSSDGDPVVLGRSRWVGDVREITINADLAGSARECDGHRFRFTLGHEFFHALEHLPLAASSGGNLRRTASLDIGFVDRAAASSRSTAQRAVKRWATSEHSRGLVTREDWREWQANVFASAILMPDWAVRDNFGDRLEAEYVLAPEDKNSREVALELAGEVLFPGKVYAKSLAQLFGVSRQAMAIRLLDLRLVREVDGQKN